MEGSDVKTMVTFGFADIKELGYWVENNKDNPGDITTFLLFPATKAGELKTLEAFIKYGDLSQLERDDKNYLGWNIYHYAVYGYQINCSYLLENGAEQALDNGSKRLTPEEARQIQLDIIYTLHKNGAPTTWNAAADGLEENIYHRPPLHPSLMALGYECSFSEAAILIDMLTLLSSNQPVETPGLDNIKITSNNDHRRALYHLIEWAYSRGHLDVLTFCHNRYLSLCSDSLRFRATNFPIFLAAVQDKRLEVIEMIFANQDKRPLPDRVLSRLYSLGKDKESPQTSAVAIACHKCLNGEPEILKDMLRHDIIGKQLVNLALSDLQLTEVPVELFHSQLLSLSLSGNFLTHLPPVQEWACTKVTSLNFTNNRFREIPPGIFSLPKLTTLNFSNNQIVSVEPSLWTAPSLKLVYLSSNRLAALPLPELDAYEMSLRPSDLASPGGVEREIVYSLRYGFIDASTEREEDFHLMYKGYSIEFLDLSDNNLTNIPGGLPCLAPMLTTLKLNSNKIANFGHVSNYPTRLKSLNLSCNEGVVCIDASPGKVREHVCLQSTPDSRKRCNHSDHTHLANLQHLNLAKNKLRHVTIETQTPPTSPLPGPSSADDTLLFPKLQSLYLNDNNLVEFPTGMDRLERLGTLDISRNIDIKQLPKRLHRLKNLIGFQYKGIGDPITATLDTFKDTAQLLYFLRARELKAVSIKSMRLFLIGHGNKGKTTIIKTLRGEKIPKEMLQTTSAEKSLPPNTEKRRDTVGIEVGKWKCTKKRTGQTIHFNTWDLAGQEEYYITHQCFFSNRALYLLVWKVTDREHGIDALPIWLRNLQATAPYAKVIIVGTHLEVLRKAEGKNTDALLDRFRKTIYALCTLRDKTAPTIEDVLFVGFTEPALFNTSHSPLKYDELQDRIYEVASKMEIPRDLDMPITFNIKLLDEKVPLCYLQLEEVIRMLVQDRPDMPIYKKTEFCQLDVVKDVINDEQEIDAAMYFLHNMGFILHFPKPTLEDYYILNPQWWFNACALVISPNNVSDLVMAGDEPGSGLLRFKAMQQMFEKKNFKTEYAGLLFSFLHQYGVLLPVDKETALVPSMISPIPTIKLYTGQGCFPRSDKPVQDRPPTHIQEFVDLLPEALRSLESDVHVEYTGLVYRRLFHFPPLPAGFWSKLITLCLQKNDFVKIIVSSSEAHLQYSLRGHGSYYNIGTACLRWRYWKTGLVLDLDGNMLLSINSLKLDEFMDPMERSIISSTYDKVRHFHFADSNGDVLPLTHYNEVIEIVVPEVDVVSKFNYNSLTSAKLLAKALEMIDEVLKGHCENLAENGIFTIGEMVHIVPCPVCFGERDTRAPNKPHPRFVNYPKLSTRIRSESIRFNKAQKSIEDRLGSDVIIVFSIDQCIRSSMTADFIECPKHKDIELQYLVPDIVFKDLARMKLNRHSLRDPPDSNGSPVGSGCFGVVYHKLLYPQYEYEGVREVAVKEFRSTDMDYDAELEVVKSYADMRYELNKLNMMQHDFIVEFVGLLSNPWSFILEWAPLMSLERIRKSYEDQFADGANMDFKYFCPISLYLILLQVADGLHYLHAPPTGIIHSDLKLSNILAYRFPDINHICCTNSQDRGRCYMCLPEGGGSYNVLVKLGDMGVSVNPAAHNNDTVGVKRFAPEIIRYDSKITEKVDIFCLALCLYELMTLRGLPPRGFSEADYKDQLRKNWRPSFHSKDPAYPIPLYTCLEQCWQQDSNLRPSASAIRSFLERTTGLTVNQKNRFRLSSENMYHLLNTYHLSTESNVTHCYIIPDHTPPLLCLAIRQDEASMVLVSEAIRDIDTNNVVFKTSLILQKVHEEVTSLFALPDKTIFIGLAGGNLLILHGNNPPCTLTLDLCRKDHQGEVTYVRYIPRESLLVYCYNGGHVHVVHGPLKDMRSQTWVYCLEPKGFLHPVTAYQSIYNQDVSFNLWLGTHKSVIEVWSFPFDSAQSEKIERYPLINLHRPSLPTSSFVSKIIPSHDNTHMFVLIDDQYRHGNGCLCEVGVADRLLKRYWQCAMSITSLSITPTALYLGARNGDINIIPLDKLREPNCKSLNPSLAIGNIPSHTGKVHYVCLYNGHIHANGYTSLFPTFLGRQREKIDVEFLLSIGDGTLNFSKTNLKSNKNININLSGTFLNMWLV